MRGVNEFNAPGFIAPPHFLPQLDASKCTYCGKCAQRCPSDAIAYTPYEVHSIDLEKCIKCDICRQVCPVEAVKVGSEVASSE